MKHRAPPPDFRYVGLFPGPSSTAFALGAGLVGVAGFDAALAYAGHEPVLIGLSFLGGAAFTLGLLGRGARVIPRASDAERVAMAIVPWGIILSPDAEPRVLRWPAIRAVQVEASHSMRGGTPQVVASMVTVETERERFLGCAPGALALERLTVHLEAYAHEASRPVAADLEGLEPCDGGVTEPVVGDLFDRAEELCTTGQGAARLCLPPGGYRKLAARVATSETVEILRRALTEDSPQSIADPRPLAAILTGMLEVRELLPELLGLVSCPHPVVAAVAKAAALRLGAPQSRAGAVCEVESFLFEDDIAHLEHWVSMGYLLRPRGAGC